MHLHLRGAAKKDSLEEGVVRCGVEKKGVSSVYLFVTTYSYEYATRYLYTHACTAHTCGILTNLFSARPKIDSLSVSKNDLYQLLYIFVPKRFLSGASFFGFLVPNSLESRKK